MEKSKEISRSDFNTEEFHYFFKNCKLEDLSILKEACKKLKENGTYHLDFKKFSDCKYFIINLKLSKLATSIVTMKHLMNPKERLFSTY